MAWHAATYLITYIILTGGLMYANTVWFELGSVKFGSEGWWVYWPLWSLLYAPPVILALVAGCFSGLPPRWKAGVIWSSLPLILAILEVTFYFDAGWTVIIIEWVGLAVAFAGVTVASRWLSSGRGT